MTVRTPVWRGYVFQRPETHRIPHLRDSQAMSKNYSDLPVWDQLFGTFENPPADTDWSRLAFGHPEADELRVGAMLCCRNVRKPATPWSKFYTLSYTLGRPNVHVQHHVDLTSHAAPPRLAVEKTLVFWAWLVMAVGYSVSGLDKAVAAPSWLNGDALRLVLANPLARDNVLRTAAAAAPPVLLRIATWVALAGELWVVPAVLFKPTRKWASIIMVAMHLGILTVINFTDLTAGVLLVHAFTLPSLLLGSRWEATPAGYYASWFPAFRAILGAYLTIHFLQLVPYAGDLFSSSGMFPDVTVLPTAGFPNALLAVAASPTAARVTILALAATAFCLATIPRARVPAALVLWYGWAALWNRNPFTSNPGMPFVGWLLLATAIWDTTPSGAPASQPALVRERLERRASGPAAWQPRHYARLVAANVLGLWGCAQTVAHCLALPSLRGLAAASVASPLPLVFSAYKGHETFANAFHYAVVDVAGGTHTGAIDPPLYSKFQAAYNYRNTFGAALAYGPFFDTPRALEHRRLILEYGYCTPGHLVRATNLTGGLDLRTITFTVVPLTHHEPLGTRWDIVVDCRHPATPAASNSTSGPPPPSCPNDEL